MANTLAGYLLQVYTAIQVCSPGTASVKEQKTQAAEFCPNKKYSAELWAAWTDFTSVSHRFVCIRSIAKATHN